MTNKPKKFRKYKPIKEKSGLPWGVTAFIIVAALQPFVWYDKIRSWVNEL